MDDITANKIVFGILVVIIFCIFYSLYLITGANILYAISSSIKNNSGNLSTERLLFLGAAVILIVGLVYWLLRDKPFTRPSLTRSTASAASDE